MKLKDSEKIMLLVLFGIAVCALSIVYIAKPNWEEKKALDTEIIQLQSRLSDLQAKAADREMYEEGIVEYSEQYQNVLDCFPADLNQEITIMFLQGIKDSNDFTIASLGLGEKSPFYTLGANGGADGTLDATANTATDSASTTEAASTEATSTETTTEAASTDAELAEGGDATDDVLTCYRAEFPIDYSGAYASLKDVVTYIDSYSDRMTVDSLDIAYTDDGVYSGQLALSCYSVEGATRPERSLELNEVEIGVENIFEGGDGSGTSNNSLNKYDEKDGADIETSYDFYTMLNAATSDVSAKIVGQNGAGKEGTVISNSDNTASSISYDFYETDGKIYCKYNLDGNQSYEAEVTSAEDVKLLIQSSERKNDDDKVEVKVTIRNATDLPVYVKVSGDDSVTPRVSVSKSGLVKVYQ